MWKSRSNKHKSNDLIDSEVPNYVGKGRYRLGRKIGKGSFGTVYQAIDTIGNMEYAVKLESIRSSTSHRLLRRECTISQTICTKESKFPTYIDNGLEGNFYFLVMQLLGPNLESVFRHCGRKFSLKTILMLGYQMINRIEDVHRHNYVFLDIKPENFVLDPVNHRKIHLVDFGLCKRFIVFNGENWEHKPFKNNQCLTGTVRYSSISAHKGIAQTRRDDLEALSYLLIYFLDGTLPWMGLDDLDSKIHHAKILERKKKISIDELCKFFPKKFSSFLFYCRNLKYEETPDYSYLRELLLSMMRDANLKFDECFDWFNANCQK